MAWVGKRPARRLGGMADVLTMAADLGFPLPVCISGFPLFCCSKVCFRIRFCFTYAIFSALRRSDRLWRILSCFLFSGKYGEY